MFTPKPIGFVSSPFKNTHEIPKGLGVKHTEEGTLNILPEFELGLTDVEGFSHLFVIWEFHRSQEVALLGTPPIDDRPHGVFATRSPRRRSRRSPATETSRPRVSIEPRRAT